MEEKSAIPEEIRTFFLADYGKTLLIKGTPGSGKTVFALTLLNTLKGNGVYVATRVDPDTLYLQYSWLKEALPADNIIDATQPEREQTAASKEISIKPLRYTNVPNFLKGVYTRTEKMEHPIVVIDSWDAVTTYIGYHEQKDLDELGHNLCEFSRRTSTKVILIAEYTGQTPLDYLVDGVIVVESDMYEARHVRRLIMQKLSGCAIKNPVALFSLNNGIFQSFTSFEGVEMKLENPLIPNPIPDPGDTRFSTGIKDLDVAIRGYGKFNLFEGDYRTYDILARAFAINSLNLGKHLLFTSTTQKGFIANIASYVKEEYRKNIEIVEDVNVEIKSAGDKIIAFINLEETEDADDAVKGVMPSVSGPGCGVICFGGRERADMVPFASTHIKTESISGIPCVYGMIPRTEIYALDISKPVISLTPIV
jgi:KaiC/GvpD/RAD55 family RecA-like ATPase